MQVLQVKEADEVEEAIIKERNADIQAIDEQVQDVANIMEHLA